MSQKIVIKANVKREPQNSLPTVSYEWHWRRIVSLAMLIVMTSAAVIYGLTSSVNADQGAHPNEQTELLITDSTQGDEVTESETHNAPSNQLHIETEHAETLPAEQLPTTQEADITNALLENAESVTVAPISDEPTITQSTVDSITEKTNTVDNSKNDALITNAMSADTTSEAVSVPASEQTSELGTIALEPASNIDAQPVTEQFAEDAHIASVALGAQIDTSKISRAVLTRSVVKREPTNVFAADVRLSQFEGSLSFFSELRGLQGQRVKHVWSFESETMAEISLNVTSPRYRTYSTKNIMNTQTGHWRVAVVDEQGNLIAQKEFRVLAN